jgi:hypothetical protein
LPPAQVLSSIDTCACGRKGAAVGSSAGGQKGAVASTAAWLQIGASNRAWTIPLRGRPKPCSGRLLCGPKR